MRIDDKEASKDDAGFGSSSWSCVAGRLSDERLDSHVAYNFRAVVCRSMMTLECGATSVAAAAVNAPRLAELQAVLDCTAPYIISANTMGRLRNRWSSGFHRLWARRLATLTLDSLLIRRFNNCHIRLYHFICIFMHTALFRCTNHTVSFLYCILYVQCVLRVQ